MHKTKVIVDLELCVISSKMTTSFPILNFEIKCQPKFFPYKLDPVYFCISKGSEFSNTIDILKYKILLKITQILPSSNAAHYSFTFIDFFHIYRYKIVYFPHSSYKVIRFHGFMYLTQPH